MKSCVVVLSFMQNFSRSSSPSKKELNSHFIRPWCCYLDQKVSLFSRIYNHLNFKTMWEVQILTGNGEDRLGDLGSNECWSQWPRGLRHELPLLARTLRSWVQIPLKAWMPVCVYFVCVVLCVGRGLATGWSLVQGVLPTVYRIKKLKKWPRSNKRTVEP
jgi:transposase InsO family protein